LEALHSEMVRSQHHAEHAARQAEHTVWEAALERQRFAGWQQEHRERERVLSAEREELERLPTTVSAERAQLTRRLTTALASRSWRLTAPMRQVGEIVRHGRAAIASSAAALLRMMERNVSANDGARPSLNDASETPIVDLEIDRPPAALPACADPLV